MIKKYILRYLGLDKIVTILDLHQDSLASQQEAISNTEAFMDTQERWNDNTDERIKLLRSIMKDHTRELQLKIELLNQTKRTHTKDDEYHTDTARCMVCGIELNICDIVKHGIACDACYCDLIKEEQEAAQ